MIARSFIFCAFALPQTAGSGGALAQTQQIVTAAAGSYTISGLAVFLPEAKSFRHGIALLTVLAMRAWVKTGEAPPDVGR